MLTTKRIKKQFGDYLCRRCINAQYHVHLKREDCRYGYSYVCPRCKAEQNIVVDFSPSGKWKVLFR